MKGREKVIWANANTESHVGEAGPLRRAGGREGTQE